MIKIGKFYSFKNSAGTRFYCYEVNDQWDFRSPTLWGLIKNLLNGTIRWNK